MLYGPVEGCAGRGVLAGARGGRAGAVAAPRPPGGRRYWWRVPLLPKYKVALFVASVGALASVTPNRHRRTAATPPHSRESGAGSWESGAGSWEPGAGSRELGAGSREWELGAGSREPGAWSRTWV